MKAAKEFTYNRDDKRRCEILKTDGTYGMGGTESIQSVTLQQLKDLEKEGFLDPEMTQNDSPSIGGIMDFMEENPRALAFGYIVSPTRDDYRVSLEGVIIPGPLSVNEVMAFANYFRYADEFDLDSNGARAWYD